MHTNLESSCPLRGRLIEGKSIGILYVHVSAGGWSKICEGKKHGMILWAWWGMFFSCAYKCSVVCGKYMTPLPQGYTHGVDVQIEHHTAGGGTSVLGSA